MSKEKHAPKINKINYHQALIRKKHALRGTQKTKGVYVRQKRLDK
jgi:hypothetical protein